MTWLLSWLCGPTPVTDLVSKCLYGLHGYCVSAVQRVNTEAPRCPHRAHSAEVKRQQGMFNIKESAHDRMPY